MRQRVVYIFIYRPQGTFVGSLIIYSNYNTFVLFVKGFLAQLAKG